MLFNSFFILTFIPYIFSSYITDKIYDDSINIVHLTNTFVKPTISKTSEKIKYYASEKTDSRKNIYINIQNLQHYTCIKFSKQKRKFYGRGLLFERKSYNKIFINKKNKNTVIQLKEACLKKYACVSYYMGLALGLIPSVNRHDRDKYVKINDQNIDDKNKKYFDKVYKSHTKLQNIGFDYGSLMNRDPFYLSTNENQTYTSKELSFYYDKMLGQRNYFTFNDHKNLYYLYCNNKPTKILCNNGGYYSVFKKKCICPEGYHGNTCSELVINSEKCDSKSYGADKNYKSLSHRGPGICFYEIYAEKGKKIEITVTEIRSTNPKEACSPLFGFQIKYDTDKSVTGLVLCGVYINDIKLPPKSNRVFIKYVGDRYDKFNVTYRAV
uniref:Astacin domain-containing protein n=1 Tax=Parastrongyloides trichosuri TaxID=131310 RepID=A0A0N5A6S4_PARTI